MRILALGALLLAGPASAQLSERAVAPLDERTVCGGALAAYHAKKTVATLDPLFACYDAADDKLKAFILEGIIMREIWDAPGFEPAGRVRLRALTAAAGREKDFEVRNAASDVNGWLHNFETYRDDKPRIAQEAQDRRDQDAQGGRLILSFIFGAGIVLQTVLFLTNSQAPNRLGKIAMALAISLVGLSPGKHEHNYELHFHVCYCFIIFALMIFSQFKNDIMAKVNESSLLIDSLIFWYLFLSYFNHHATEKTFMAIAALPTLGTLAIALTIRQWSFAVRLACYVWFLILVLVISCFQVRFGDMSFIWTSAYAQPRPLNLFLTGMGFTYLAASAFYIYILIPIADKNQTSAQRMEIWRQDAHQMASNFADYQMTATQALTIMAVQGGLYAGNYFFKWIPVPLAVNLSLIVLPLAFKGLFRNPPSTQPAP